MRLSGGRSGQGHDHPDLDLVLREGRPDEAEQDHKTYQLALYRHDYFPDRECRRRPKVAPNAFFPVQAYSDEARCRKQSRGEQGQPTKQHASRAPFA